LLYALEKNGGGFAFLRKKNLMCYHAHMKSNDAYNKIARWYDLEHATYAEDLALYQSFAEATGGPILEAGCGSGRLLVPLARAGYSLAGVDTSPAMLEHCQTALYAEKLATKVDLIQADMTQFDVGRHDFRLAFIALGTLNHLPDLATRKSALSCLRAHVIGGATLILDVAQAEPRRFATLAESGQIALIGTWQDATNGDILTHTAAARFAETPATLTLTHWYDVHQQGEALRRTCVETTLTAISHPELELLLSATGWRARHWYGDHDLGEWDESSPRLIVVAQAAE
jgi:SAM-dependent methyltransferase